MKVCIFRISNRLKLIRYLLIRTMIKNINLTVEYSIDIMKRNRCWRYKVRKPIVVIKEERLKKQQ